jgi:hypothetical protein
MCSSPAYQTDIGDDVRADHQWRIRLYGKGRRRIAPVYEQNQEVPPRACQ